MTVLCKESSLFRSPKLQSPLKSLVIFTRPSPRSKTGPTRPHALLWPPSLSSCAHLWWLLCSSIDRLLNLSLACRVNIVCDHRQPSKYILQSMCIDCCCLYLKLQAGHISSIFTWKNPCFKQLTVTSSVALEILTLMFMCQR